MTPPRLPLALRVLAWRVRPLLLAGALVCACALAARLAAPPPPPTAPVVVAAADLPAGSVLTTEDLRTARLPLAAVPRAAVADPAALAGAVLAVDVPAGLPLVSAHVSGGRFATDAPAGTVAVPVRLADAAVAALLRPGDRVDLVSAGGWSGTWSGAAEAAPGAPAVLASAALVLDVVVGEETGGLGLLGGASGGDDPLVVVAVTVAEGHRIAAAAGGSLGAVLVAGD